MHRARPNKDFKLRVTFDYLWSCACRNSRCDKAERAVRTDVRLTHITQDGSGKVKRGEWCSWGMLSMSVFAQLSDLIRDERCIAADNPPPFFFSSCSIFYFFLSPGFFIYSTNLFHPTGPCLKSLLPAMVYTSYGTAFPLFSVPSQRCTDSTSEAHLSCMCIFIKKNKKQNKTLVRGHLHSKQASKTLQLTVLKAEYELSVWLFIYSSSNFTQPGSGADIE